jgi:hypothetical protein
MAAALNITAMAATACHQDSSTAPLVATAISELKGAGAQLMVGTNAPDTLSVVATTSAGQPVSGVTVTWTLTQGDGTLSTTSSITDANGVATVFYAAGESAEEVVVMAAAQGLTPVMIDFDQVNPPPPSTGNPSAQRRSGE